MTGWIKIARSIQEHWIWQDAEKLKWWLDLLLMANYDDTKKLARTHLITLKRGQIEASIAFLAKRWGRNAQTVIRFLSLLEVEKMITREVVYGSIGIITICKYESYQTVADTSMYSPIDSPTYSSIDSPIDSSTYSSVDTIKRNKEDKEIKEVMGKSAKRFIPPTLAEINSYIQEKGYTVDAERFFNFYESKGWMVGKNKMKNWHAAIATWQKTTKEQQYGISKQRNEDRCSNNEISATGEKDYSTSF